MTLVPPDLLGVNPTQRLGIVLERYVPLGKEAVRAVLAQEVERGLLTGTNPLTVASTIRKRIGAITYTRAATIARTEMMTAGWIRTQSLFARDRTVTEWQWLAAWNACEICQTLHGQRFPTRDRMRSHPNCRCTMTPVTRFGLAIPRNEWGTTRIGKMSAGQQAEMFGPGRAAFLQSGGSPLDLIGTKVHPLYGPSPTLIPLRGLR